MDNLEWVISHSTKMSFHTDLGKIISPIRNELDRLNWIVGDVEFMASPKVELPIDHEQEYFVLSCNDFLKLANSKNHVQMIWGVFLGFSNQIPSKIEEKDIPYVEKNLDIWKPESIQHPDALIEIDCIDSSYTLVKFRDENLSNQFKNYFTEAIPLKKFIKKF